MIAPGKLKDLPEKVRIRKYIKILKSLEDQFSSGNSVSWHYLHPVLTVLRDETVFSNEVQSLIRTICVKSFIENPDETTVFIVHRLRSCFLDFLGESLSDWDLYNETDSVEITNRTSFPMYLYVDGIRSPFNLGSLFRSAEAFGVRHIFVSPHTVDVNHPRCIRSAMGSTDIIPWSIAAHPKLCKIDNIFALETGGQDIGNFGFLCSDSLAVIGSEELGVQPGILKQAESSRGIVSIPLYGVKASLNVSVATGILLSRWSSVFSD